MPKTYIFNAEQQEELLKAERRNKNKYADKRIKALLLRSQGVKPKVIAEETKFNQKYISELVAKYFKGGIAAITENHYGGNRRNISIEEEQVLLKHFEELAKSGQIVETSDIKREYEAKVGHRIGKGQIYRVLKRHGWRKIMPRSKHPKKASPEDIESSKKLTLLSENGW